MKHIFGTTTGEVWKKAAAEVYLHGNAVKDGDANLKECLNIFLTIEKPLESDPILRDHADPRMIEWMRDNFLKLEPVSDWGYSYGQRFLSYDGIDQIEQVITKLKKNPESKSATITLMNPLGDQHHMPCIVAIDFKIREGKLMTTASFRSQDVGKKLYADVICIGEIAKKIADQTSCVAGDVILHIVSLHAYETDWNAISRLMS